MSHESKGIMRSIPKVKFMYKLSEIMEMCDKIKISLIKYILDKIYDELMKV